MSAAEVLRQAEELKAAVTDTARGANEIWVSRQRLQDIYQNLLIVDLEFALDQKVEQDLWNHAFKKQISTLQNQAKGKQNHKRGEVQSSLNLFLETASGFYLHLLQLICNAFKLDLPFRKKSSSYGIVQEYGPVMGQIKYPNKASCMYICQDCLVHLGDIARYRQQVEQAQVYYRHAAHLVPYNGQPYNQLAILEAAKGNRLSTVFFHIRSIAVKHPFPVAMTNLEKFYAKISKDSYEYRQKLSANELIGMFLQLHAFVHLCIDLARAKSHAIHLITCLPAHILMSSFSSYQLVQMVAINLFSICHAKRKLNGTGMAMDAYRGSTNRNSEALTDSRKFQEKTEENLKSSFHLLLELTLSMFEVLLQSTPKDESKAKRFHTLAPIKVLLDWLHTDLDILSYSSVQNSLVWVNLSELFNCLLCFLNQSELENDLHRRLSTPLPEDCDLECFLPVIKAQSDLRYYSTSSESMTDDMESNLRCHKLLMSGFWIAEEFASLNLLNTQQLADGRIEFTSQIRPPQGNCVNHKSSNQNIVLQDIVQKNCNIEKKHDTVATPARHVPSKATGTDTKDFVERHDGTLAHPLLSTAESDRLSEKSFSSWSSVDRPFSSQGSASSPGSCNSVSMEMTYHREFQPVAMPSTGPSSQQHPYYYPQQGAANVVFASPPPAFVSELPVVSQLCRGGTGGQKMTAPADVECIVNADLNPALENGTGYSAMPVDGFCPSRGFNSFLVQDGLGPSMASQNRAYFRAGQPYPYGNMVGCIPQHNVTSMYIAKQEDPLSRPLPTAMSVVPPQQMQWSGQPYNYPPPKLTQALHEDSASLGTKAGFLRIQNSTDPNVLDSVSYQIQGLGRCFPAPSAGTGFPIPPKPDPVNNRADMNGEMESPYGGHPGVFGIQRNGVHLSEILEGIPSAIGSSQSPGIFQVENRITEDVSPRRQSPDCRKEKLKANSPQPIGSRPQSSLYTSMLNQKKEQQPMSNTYSLFSQSPWPVRIAKSADGNSQASSTFDSSSSSLRTTPDPDERPCVSSRAGLFGRATTAPVNEGPWNTPSLSGNSMTSTTLPGSGTLMGSSLQSIWNGAPSPLEKLLEQQKQQRQCEPR